MGYYNSAKGLSKEVNTMDDWQKAKNECVRKIHSILAADTTLTKETAEIVKLLAESVNLIVEAENKIDYPIG